MFEYKYNDFKARELIEEFEIFTFAPFQAIKYRIITCIKYIIIPFLKFQ